MVGTHELKDGEGSIRIGATGKVSALMMQELDSITSSSNTCTCCKRRTQTAPVSISCGVSTRRLQQRKASSNSSKTVGRLTTSSGHHRTPGSIQRKKQNVRQTTQSIPMLGMENISVGNTPNRSKPEKKRSQIVEIVDLKCGKPHAAWSHPIGNQLRRLSFSKLSD